MCRLLCLLAGCCVYFQEPKVVRALRASRQCHYRMRELFLDGVEAIDESIANIEARSFGYVQSCTPYGLQGCGCDRTH